jgi:minor histocompatibility antigen H13
LLIGSYFNAAVLLSGLFFYDIFWVFGTDVMVTVARSFDAPIKLLFPTASGHPSMLGLGDIVIPGLFIALMMRFDVWLVVKGHVDKEKHNFKYFWNIMMWYFLGLTTTVLVMYHFKSAQPALLYLVPACLLGSFLPVALGGHLKLLWQYNDPGNEPEDDSKDKKD